MANTYKSINLTIAGASDIKVKVSADDTASGFLEDKVVAGSTKVTTATLNPGANEQLEVDVDDTQIDHDVLLNYDVNEHRSLDDASTTSISLWSSTKIQSELDTKVDKVSSTDNAVPKFNGTSGDVQNTAVIIDDLNNITGVNDLTIDGNLTVNGTTTSVNSSTLDVTDANVTVNNGGDQASANLAGAGLTIEMSDATDAVLAYDSSLASKFAIGELGSEAEVVTISHTQTLSNKSVDADNNTISNLEVDNLKAGVLQTDISGAVSDTNIASSQAVKTYVDGQLALQDDASEITYTPSTLSDWDSSLDPGNVDGGLDQIASRVTTAEGTLSTHLDGGAAKHTATSISNVPAGNITATDVQAALNELDTEKYIAANFNGDFTTQFATKDTDDLTEGVTNLYFTNARAHVENGDIASTDFSFLNNIVTFTDITGFTFSSLNTRTFEAQISVDRAGDSLYEKFNIEGVYNGTSWDFSIESIGSDSGIEFNVDSTGQVQYKTSNLTSGGVMSFRANVTAK